MLVFFGLAALCMLMTILAAYKFGMALRTPVPVEIRTAQALGIVAQSTAAEQLVVAEDGSVRIDGQPADGYRIDQSAAFAIIGDVFDASERTALLAGARSCRDNTPFTAYRLCAQVKGGIAALTIEHRIQLPNR